MQTDGNSRCADEFFVSLSVRLNETLQRFALISLSMTKADGKVYKNEIALRRTVAMLSERIEEALQQMIVN